MAITGRLRSGFPALPRAFAAAANMSTPETSIGQRNLFRTTISSRFSRNYASSPPAQQQKIKVPLQMYGVSGNYATALYLAAVKANVIDRVESELLALVEASKRSPLSLQFMKDLSTTAAMRVEVMEDICTAAQYSDTTRNFLLVVAENARLGHLQRIVQRFSELTMAHRGEVKAVVTTVIALPPEEEKNLKETLEDMLGEGKKALIEQKIDPSILGGLVVEFNQKIFDTSIKTRAQEMERFLRQSIHLDNAFKLA